MSYRYCARVGMNSIHIEISDRVNEGKVVYRGVIKHIPKKVGVKVMRELYRAYRVGKGETVFTNCEHKVQLELAYD